MVICPIFGCLLRSEPNEKPQTGFETEIVSKLEESVKTISETTTGTEGWRSITADAANVKDQNQPRILVEFEEFSDEGCTKKPEMSDEGLTKKPDMERSKSEDTVGDLKTRNELRCSTFVRRQTKPIRNPTRYSNFKPIFGSLERNRVETVMSDWADCYEDAADLRMSNFETASFQRVYGSAWSDCGTSSYNSPVPRIGSSFVLKKKSISPRKMPCRPGMVWAMRLSKEGQRFKLVNLSITVNELVDTFLSVETGQSLPVSFTFTNLSRPKLLPAEKMRMTLSEILKGYLDEMTQGLSFFVGPVNSKLCYKMSVCELDQLEQLFSMPKRQSSTIKQKPPRLMRSADL